VGSLAVPALLMPPSFREHHMPEARLQITARMGDPCPPVKVLCSCRPRSTHNTTQDKARFPRRTLLGDSVNPAQKEMM
jgi:hypothetical protein